MIPNPKHWYIHDGPADAEEVAIYDGSDYRVLTVESREADEEVGMEAISARELALFILKAVGAETPIQYRPGRPPIQ